MKKNNSFTEKELINLIKQNDRQAKRQLYQIFSRKVKGRIYVRLERRYRIDLLKDIEQDIWIDIYNSISNGNYKPEKGKLSYYIGSICNKSFSKHFKHYVDKRIMNVVDQDELANLFYHNDPNKLSEKLERIDKMYKHVRMLNQKHREVMYLRLVERLSYKQIAERLNIHPSTARGRFRTAKMIIKTKINKKGKS